MKKKVALVVSTPITFNVFYKNHIKFLQEKYDITLIANFSLDKCTIENVRHIHIPIERKPSVFSDLKVLFQLISIFRREKFDVVHSTTPKAGLLGQLAAYMAGVKIRLHIFTGQVWANKIGYKREVLKFIDKVIAFLPNYLLADSFSQKIYIENENIVVKNKVKVLGLGSISGVNLNKFYPKNTTLLRTELLISLDQFVFLFLGRLNKDKGILDLLKAFEIVNDKNPESVLMLVGRDEENLLPIIENNPRFNKSIFYRNFTNQPEDYMSMADVFCLPSYREGFGSVIIEAAACGTPSIGSNIYGISDAIEDNRSGLLSNVADPNNLAEKMNFMIENKKILQDFSSYGLKRVTNSFDENKVSQDLVLFYENMFKEYSC